MQQMMSEVNALAQVVLSARRKGFLRRKPVFERYTATSQDELRKLETEIGAPLPNDLRNWLLAVGYGDIDEQLSFRRDWFASIESGQLKGGARFAQDILGNFYAFDRSGGIFFLSRSEPVFVAMSDSFSAFVEELVRLDYKLLDWVNDQQTEQYHWQQ